MSSEIEQRKTEMFYRDWACCNCFHRCCRAEVTRRHCFRFCWKTRYAAQCCRTTARSYFLTYDSVERPCSERDR